MITRDKDEMHTQFLQIGKHQLTAACLNPGVPGELYGIASSTSFWQVNPPPIYLNLAHATPSA